MTTQKKKHLLDRLVLNTARRVVESRARNKNVREGMPPSFDVDRCVTGPNDVSDPRFLRGFLDMSECIGGDRALSYWTHHAPEICESAQSIPGLRLLAELDDDPSRKALAEARIAVLQK